MSQWIKCSDRLPEVGIEVLVYRPDAKKSDDPLIRTSFYRGKEYGHRQFNCFVQPSHWMPLPDLPTE